MGISNWSHSYYGWSFENEEELKKLTIQLNPKKYTHGTNVFDVDVDDDYDTIVNEMFTTLKKHLAFEQIESDLDWTIAGDYSQGISWDTASILFGINVKSCTKEEFEEKLEKNKIAFKKLTLFLGEPEFVSGCSRG